MKTFFSNEYLPVPSVSTLQRGSCHVLIPKKMFQRLALNLEDVVTISIFRGCNEGKTFVGRAWLSHLDEVEWDPTVYVKKETTCPLNSNWELTQYDSSEVAAVCLAVVHITSSNPFAKSFVDYLIGQRISVVFNSVNYIQFRSETIQIDIFPSETSKTQVGEFSKVTRFIWLDQTTKLSRHRLVSLNPLTWQYRGWYSCHEKTFRKICEFFETTAEENALNGFIDVQGILLCGPSGVGKTCTVRMAAKYCSVPFFELQGKDLSTFEYFGQAEQALKKLFFDAKRCSLALLFIDEVDSLCPKFHEHSENLNRRITSQLACLLDELRQDTTKNRILCIAATKHPYAVDPTLRIPGRFDKELVLLPPSEEERKDMLSKFLQFYHCHVDAQLISEMVHLSNGFVGIDFSQVFLESLRAWTISVKDNLSEVLLEKIKSHTPSLLRGPYTLEIPLVGWNDIGGYENVKQRLKMAVEWPRKYSSLWKHFHLKAPRGILLQGPPGCSKTTLVKATANESGLPILYLSGAELYSCFLGESESILRMAFEIARSVSPSLLFIDELDSVLGKRQVETEGNLVKERLLSTFLTEMDGIVSAEQVLVIGATNRSDLLDEALLRPGRFDEIIQVDLPDASSRKQIFQIYLRGTELDSFNWNEILESTQGWSGAEIANVCRQAVFHALRHDKTIVTIEDICFLLDKLKYNQRENHAE
ncbi:Cell division cycle protein 48 homolog AF_1297 [Galdieria sulphuraria]|nr:Cell division cycle protein 48 homolog AF_1297 [Galdieria sulphuraria]